MNHCPICWLAKQLHKIHYHIWSWYHYSILKEPRPNPYETIADLMPIIFGASVAMSLSKEYAELVEDIKMEMRKDIKLKKEEQIK